MARTAVPEYIETLVPDLVVFHNTFLLARANAEYFERITSRIRFLQDLSVPKALLSSDECWSSDRLVEFINDFGITHVFSFAPACALPIIYAAVDTENVSFHTVQTAYVDSRVARRIERSAKRNSPMTIDIGARVVASPTLGRHGQLREKIIDVFSQRAPAFGYSVDLSSEPEDTLWGDEWFDFLLKCRYTLGVEAGGSMLDRDGTALARTVEYLKSHENPIFEEIEAACFPGLDGNIDYRALAPRHLEAIMTRTCQVLVEGDYSGVLRPGEHYLEVKRDFSNVDEILKLMRDEALREEIVERAYRDIVASGRYSYQVFADCIFQESLQELPGSGKLETTALPSRLLIWNRVDERLWPFLAWFQRERLLGRFQQARQQASDSFRSTLRPVVSVLVGEDRLKGFLSRLRK